MRRFLVSCPTLVVLLALTALVVSGCGGRAVYRAAPHGVVLEGVASFYHDSLHGNLTANGERYDRRALTAAHRSLPFGTVVRVTNRENGKSIRVRINDRGPFVKGRIIDLSRRGAEQLDFVRRGIVDVRVEVLN